MQFSFTQFNGRKLIAKVTADVALALVQGKSNGAKTSGLEWAKVDQYKRDKFINNTFAWPTHERPSEST